MPKTIAYDTLFNYGSGADSSAEQIRGSAIIPTAPASLSGAAGAEVTYTTHVVESQRQLEESLGVSAAMSLLYGFVAGGNAKVDFAQTNTMSENSLSVVVTAIVKNPVLLMSNVKLIPEAKDLYAKNPESFKQRYGDMYVNGIRTGGEMFGLILMRTTSSEHKSALSTSLHASGGFGLVSASLDASVTHSIQEAIKDTDASIYVHTSGYTPPHYPQTVPELLELAASFPAQVKSAGQATPYAMDLLDYKFLDLPDGPNLADLQNRDDVIQWAADLKAKAMAKRASIEYIRGNPQLFRGIDDHKLSDYESQLNVLLDQIHRRISACFNDYRQCSFTQDLVLPTMELPEATGAEESPIAAKYKLTGGPSNSFLGKPTTPELPCMDGIGKYQNFQIGAIYSHPTSGTFEVHGTIYKKYQELRCEQGALGYPVSDEKSQANSVDRYSVFKNGSITWVAKTNVATEHINPSIISLRFTHLVANAPLVKYDLSLKK